MKAARRLPLDAHLYVLRTASDWSAAKASYACSCTMRLESGKSSYPVVGSKYASGVFSRLKRIHKKIPKEIISENTSADHLAIKISDPKKTRNKRIFKRILKRLSLKSLKLVIQRIRRIKKVFANVFVGLL